MLHSEIHPEVFIDEEGMRPAIFWKIPDVPKIYEITTEADYKRALKEMEKYEYEFKNAYVYAFLLDKVPVKPHWRNFFQLQHRHETDNPAVMRMVHSPMIKEN